MSSGKNTGCAPGRPSSLLSSRAAFFHLYGVERDDVDSILETFPIVKRKDVQVHGDYRTKLVILDIYDRLQEAIDTGEPYPTRLDPPPGDASVAHPARAGEDP